MHNPNYHIVTASYFYRYCTKSTCEKHNQLLHVSGHLVSELLVTFYVKKDDPTCKWNVNDKFDFFSLLFYCSNNNNSYGYLNKIKFYKTFPHNYQ